MEHRSFQGMPAFRDPDGSVWVWDAESSTMVKKPAGTEGHPDRGHATGGDNDLFDPFQHTEESGVPELEGYMAAASELIPKNTEAWSPQGKVNCPNCSTSTGDHVCPTCGKDLTPEWNQSQHNEFQDVHPEFDTRNEFISDPERTPKRNELHTDDQFPSMNLSHNAHVTSVKPLFFSHVDEELAWREANSPSLDECPECHDPMVEQDGDKVCHGCGHKQKVIEAKSAGALALLPEAAGLLEGGGAAAAAGGAAEGGGGIAGIGGLMNKALQGGAFREGEDLLGGGGGAGAPGAAAGPGTLQPGIISAVKEAGIMGDLVEFLVDKMKQGGGVVADAVTDPRNPLSYADDVAGLANGLQQGQPQAGHFAKGTFGEEEVGRATKNDGQNSDPDQQSSSGDDPKEFGDSPEQLKDVDGIGGPTSPDDADQLGDQGDPHLQEKALKAFHLNKPLILELANSDEAGSDNPILLALDAILEEAFPGYRGGTGDGTSEHPQEGNTDEPSDEASDDSKKSPASDDSSDKKESAYQTPRAQRTQGIVEAASVTSLWTALGNPYDESPTKDVDYGPDDDEEKKRQEDQDRDDEDAARDREHDAHVAGAMGGQPPNQFGAAPSMAPGSGAPGVAGANPPCAMCGQPHMPGVPCPTDVSQNQPQPLSNGAPISPMPAPNVVTTKLAKWEIVSFEPMIPTPPPAQGGANAAAPPCPACGGPGTPLGLLNGAQSYKCMNCGNTYTGVATTGGAGEAVAAPAASGQISGPSPSGYSMSASLDDEFGFYTAADHSGGSSEWMDVDGAPLLAGHKYDLVSHDYAIPDKITVDNVYPDKIAYTIHASSTDPSSLPYHSELTRQELDTMGYKFIASEEVGNEEAGPGEDPIRPGQDAIPQVDDLSTPSTTVSSFDPLNPDPRLFTGSYDGDVPQDRSWVLEGGLGQGVDVDPGLAAKLAGKDFSGQEQRGFIDEAGTARNLDKLDLEGTHYLEDDLDSAFNWS